MICDQIKKCRRELHKPKDSWIDPQGGKSTFRIDNPNRKKYYKVDIENCVYESSEKNIKCDYLLLVDNSAIFIELKGGNIREGLKQLLATIRDSKKCFEENTIMARMVANKYRTPKILQNDPLFKRLLELTNHQFQIKKNLTEIL